ncbi:MAG: Fe-Mn family superoxide dismutase [Armatimonadota bacterium]|nr:Fe-Mn family superoxide dismutase [Armatimonadota bacterium]MDR5703835.1 Fe-Mn family superoxide dismutase [Armatimonadota bacterium]MDR7434228.1 Fe-Mn family superoxide dismutase [Armatimonadota bacterium]
MNFAKYEAKKFRSFEVELDGISKKTMEEHYKLYQGYVNKANEILEKLAAMEPDPAKANPTYSEIRELKVELTRAIGGVKNHEIYFDILGGKGGKPQGRLLEAIERDFGSFENWQKDLKATGIAARGWAWLAYDWDTGRLFNYIGDEQNTYPIWNATPIVALDVFEHAFFIDYGTNKGAYIDAFFRNLDWGAVEERVRRMNIPGLA